MSSQYAQLVALAEREWSLVSAGAWEQLGALDGERAALVAGLPAVPPAAAAGQLQRLAELQALIGAALAGARAASACELGRLTAGRGAVQGYAASAAQQRTSR